MDIPIPSPKSTGPGCLAWLLRPWWLHFNKFPEAEFVGWGWGCNWWCEMKHFRGIYIYMIYNMYMAIVYSTSWRPEALMIIRTQQNYAKKTLLPGKDKMGSCEGEWNVEGETRHKGPTKMESLPKDPLSHLHCREMRWAAQLGVSKRVVGNTMPHHSHVILSLWKPEDEATSHPLCSFLALTNFDLDFWIWIELP